MASTSILDDIKSSIGIVPEYTEFDKQLIVLINSAFSTLHQLGYGPDGGFEIEDNTTTWDKYITSPRFNFIKSYLIARACPFLSKLVVTNTPTASFSIQFM